jgi:hypothetical protein
MARLAICTPIGLISLVILALFDERRAKLDFIATNDQRMNKMHYTNRTSVNVSTRFFDLNATLADTFVRDSIGPNVTTVAEIQEEELRMMTTQQHAVSILKGTATVLIK